MLTKQIIEQRTKEEEKHGNNEFHSRVLVDMDLNGDGKSYFYFNWTIKEIRNTFGRERCGYCPKKRL